jgi:hypothetical protein
MFAFDREQLIADALYFAALTLRNAMTDKHPAFDAYIQACNKLTPDELRVVPRLVYAGLRRGGFDIYQRLRD